MSGLKGRSGPPGNMNAFRHGLSAIQKRRESGVTTEHEESIKAQILYGLMADKGGEAQMSTALKVLAEIIASDAAFLVVFNDAIWMAKLDHGSKMEAFEGWGEQEPLQLVGSLEPPAGVEPATY